MTREEAIEELLCMKHLVRAESDADKALDMAIEALSDVPDTNVGKWIPCSERLPEEDTNVLVTVHFHGLVHEHPSGWNDHIKPSYYVEVASQIDGEWSSYSDEYKVARNRHEVIAWMPLPEAYKEVKE